MARLKFNEYDMYYYSYLSIRARYPFSKGFIIKEQDRSKVGYRPDFLIQKRIKYRQTSYYYKIIAEVKADAVILPQHIAQINWYAKNHSGKHSFIIAKYLIIPTYTSIERVRKLLLNSGIEVIRLRGFKR